MILVLGARASGKRTFVESLGVAREEMADGVLDDRPALFNLQDLVAENPDDIDALVEPLAQKRFVICNEVGAGVIPAEKEQIIWREKTGRLCTLLAQKADVVVRMVCGIPQVLKGEL